MSHSVRPQRRQPTRLPRPWDSPGKNTGVGCHFLLQCMKVESESEVAQSCPTLSDPMDCSLPGSSVHRIFQARVLEWGAIAFSDFKYSLSLIWEFPDTHILIQDDEGLAGREECIIPHVLSFFLFKCVVVTYNHQQCQQKTFWGLLWENPILFYSWRYYWLWQ